MVGTKTDFRKKLAKTARAAVLAGAVTLAVGAIAGCSTTGGGISCKGVSSNSCKGVASCKGKAAKANSCSGKNGCGSKK